MFESILCQFQMRITKFYKKIDLGAKKKVSAI